MAIQCDHPETADLLRKHGAKPVQTTAKAPDISIIEAAFRGNLEAVKQYIAAGTDVNAKNDGGRTPLDYAKRKPKIAALLRKHGGKTSEESKATGK